jgi:hypothetical protein
MHAYPKSLRTHLHSRKPLTRRPSRPNLQLERLEDRLVPADYSVLPLLLGGYPHSGPTNLALNFTGGAYQNSYQVQPWQTARQNYDDLLFRVSELFAPFNVQVYYQPGFGTFTPGAGSTTVFVGPSIGRQNTGPGVTPGAWVDHPTSADPTHRPDSDPLHGAFVDPTQAQNNSNLAATALSIAHEAGHTFGLEHVRTDGLTDNGGRNALGTGTVPDVMNYNTTMQGGIFFQQYFSFRSLNLTDFNAGSPPYVPASHPNWNGDINGQRVSFVPDTQSSFFYLKYVLGDRPDRRYHVADQNVDPTMDFVYHYRSTADTLGQGLVETRQRSIDRLGDYEVERWTASRTQTIELDVTAANQTTGLKPVLLVHDSNGNLVGSAYPGQTNGGTIKYNFAVQGGKTYYFIVGSGVTQNTGDYTFRLVQETHTFYVAINSLVDHIPDPDPKNLARYTTEARVEIGNQDGISWLQGNNGLYSLTLPVVGNSGQVPMRIDVFRRYHPVALVEAGIIRYENGRWVVHYKDGSLGSITDENGHWVVHYPNGTSHDTGVSTEMFTSPTFIPTSLLAVISTPAPGVQTGTVRSINLTYNLATQTIVGLVDGLLPVSGQAMQPVAVPGGSRTPDLTFTIAMDQAPPVFTGIRLGGLVALGDLLTNGASGKGVGVIPLGDLAGSAAGAPAGGSSVPTPVIDTLFARQSSSTSAPVTTIPVTPSTGSTAPTKKTSGLPTDALFGPLLS